MCPLTRWHYAAPLPFALILSLLSSMLQSMCPLTRWHYAAPLPFSLGQSVFTNYFVIDLLFYFLFLFTFLAIQY